MRSKWTFVLVLLLLVMVSTQASANPVTASRTNPAQLTGGRFLHLVVGVDSLNTLNAGNFRLASTDLQDHHKERLLESVPDDLRLDVQAAPYAGLKFGPVGLSLRGQTLGQVAINRDVLDLILFGNELNRDYRVGDFNAYGAGYSEAAVTLALKVPRTSISIGATGKALHGFVYGEAISAGGITAEAVLDPDQDERKHQAKAGIVGELEAETWFVMADTESGNGGVPVGTGFGYDLGARMGIGPRWEVEASILNFNSSIVWTDVEYTRFKGDLVVDLGNLDDIRFEADEEETKVLPTYEWKLPQTTRIGTTFQLTRTFMVWGDMSWTHYGEEVDVSTQQSTGFEFNFLRFIPMEAGLRWVDGKMNLDTAIGIRLPIFDVGVSAVNPHGYWSENVAGMGIGVRVHVGF